VSTPSRPPRTALSRRLYRAYCKAHDKDPIPSRSPQGRFHDATTGPTTYLAATAETAWKEVTFRWGASRSTYRIAEVRVSVTAIADLTDPAIQKRYGIDERLLTADDHRLCQGFANRLRAEGYEGIWTYSRADVPNGRQLVVFLDCLRAGSELEVETRREISE
jgi:hypothetical protein